MASFHTQCKYVALRHEVCEPIHSECMEVTVDLIIPEDEGRDSRRKAVQAQSFSVPVVSR